MENASKALLIAGAVLIALLIISLGVMVYNNFSKNVTENTDLSDQEISALNSKILPYVGENISGSKVNALITVVYAMNRNIENEKVVMSWKFKKDGETEYTTGGIDNTGNYKSGSKKVRTGVYYTVEVKNYNSAGLISEIEIKQN